DGHTTDSSFEVYGELRGRFQNVHPWELLLDRKGAGTLTVYALDGKKVKKLRVQESKMEELVKIVAETGFFDLPKEIGNPIPDAGERIIRIKSGKQNHTVIIHRTTSSEAERIWAKLEELFDQKDVAK